MDLQKNLDRLENLLFHICGCTKDEARQVVETFLNEMDLSAKEKREIRQRRNEDYESKLDTRGPN